LDGPSQSTSKREKILHCIQEQRDALDASVNNATSLNNAHVCCRTPQWDPKSNFEKALEEVDPRRQRVRREGKKAADMPVLHACFVKGFPRSDRRPHPVYRIKVWLDQLPALRGSLRVTYELHPENERPISRMAFGLKHEMWLNTNSDYTIRARTNDGREWDLGWLSDALRKGSGNTKMVKVSDPGAEESKETEEPFDTALEKLRVRPAVPPEPRQA